MDKSEYDGKGKEKHKIALHEKANTDRFIKMKNYFMSQLLYSRAEAYRMGLIFFFGLGGWGVGLAPQLVVVDGSTQNLSTHFYQLKPEIHTTLPDI